MGTPRQKIGTYFGTLLMVYEWQRTRGGVGKMIDGTSSVLRGDLKTLTGSPRVRLRTSSSKRENSRVFDKLLQ